MPGSNIIGLCSLPRDSNKPVTTLTITVSASGSITTTKTPLLGGPDEITTSSYDGFEIVAEWARIPYSHRDFVNEEFPEGEEFWLTQLLCCCPCRIGIRAPGQAIDPQPGDPDPPTDGYSYFNGEYDFSVDADPATPVPGFLRLMWSFSTADSRAIKCKSGEEDRAAATTLSLLLEGGLWDNIDGIYNLLEWDVENTQSDGESETTTATSYPYLSTIVGLESCGETVEGSASSHWTVNETQVSEFYSTHYQGDVTLAVTLELT